MQGFPPPGGSKNFTSVLVNKMATDSVSERNGKSDVFGLYSHDDDLFVVFPSDRITLGA